MPELGPALRLGHRGRLLTVVCQDQHALVRVLATGRGPVALAEVTTDDERGWDEVHEDGSVTSTSHQWGSHRAEQRAYVMRELGDVWWQIEAECRCRRIMISGPRVAQALAAGRRRTIGEPLSQAEMDAWAREHLG